MSFAKHFGAQLVMLHVLRAAPIPAGFHWFTAGDLEEMRHKAHIDCERQLEKLAFQNGPVDCNLKFMVKFGIASEQILLAAPTLQAGLIILGLNVPHTLKPRHTCRGLSPTRWFAAHCPVLTIGH